MNGDIIFAAHGVTAICIPSLENSVLRDAVEKWLLNRYFMFTKRTPQSTKYYIGVRLSLMQRYQRFEGRGFIADAAQSQSRGALWHTDA